MAAVSVRNNFGDQKNSLSLFPFFPFDLWWSDGTRCHDISRRSISEQMEKLRPQEAPCLAGPVVDHPGSPSSKKGQTGVLCPSHGLFQAHYLKYSTSLDKRGSVATEAAWLGSWGIFPFCVLNQLGTDTRNQIGFRSQNKSGKGPRLVQPDPGLWLHTFWPPLRSASSSIQHWAQMCLLLVFTRWAQPLFQGHEQSTIFTEQTTEFIF